MKRFGIILATALAAVTSTAVAQDRVSGPRPVDPRLRNQPTINKAVPGPSQTQGGPLQRPSYLRAEASAAASSGPSALDLMTQCFEGSATGAIVNASCVGYLAGFVGAVRIGATTVPGYPVCLPEAGIPNEAIVSDVSGYLEQNPDALQKSARSVVFLVLSQKYPCGE